MIFLLYDRISLPFLCDLQMHECRLRNLLAGHILRVAIIKECFAVHGETTANNPPTVNLENGFRDVRFMTERE